MNRVDEPTAFERINEARLFVAGQLKPNQSPKVGIVLGSGLGLLADRLADRRTVRPNQQACAACSSRRVGRRCDRRGCRLRRREQGGRDGRFRLFAPAE